MDAAPGAGGAAPLRTAVAAEQQWGTEQQAHGESEMEPLLGQRPGQDQGAHPPGDHVRAAGGRAPSTCITCNCHCFCPLRLCGRLLAACPPSSIPALPSPSRTPTKVIATSAEACRRAAAAQEAAPLQRHATVAQAECVRVSPCRGAASSRPWTPTCRPPSRWAPRHWTPRQSELRTLFLLCERVCCSAAVPPCALGAYLCPSAAGLCRW